MSDSDINDRHTGFLGTRAITEGPPLGSRKLGIGRSAHHVSFVTLARLASDGGIRSSWITPCLSAA